MKEIVIKIPNKVYDYVKREWIESDFDSPLNHVMNGVKNGAELPKGHGRLIDIDKAIENEETFRKYFSITTHPLMNVKIINCTAPSVVEEDTGDTE